MNTARRVAVMHSVQAHVDRLHELRATEGSGLDSRYEAIRRLVNGMPSEPTAADVLRLAAETVGWLEEMTEAAAR